MFRFIRECWMISEPFWVIWISEIYFEARYWRRYIVDMKQHYVLDRADVRDPQFIDDPGL